MNLTKENFENITTFYKFRKREDGFPDGMITDSKDNLWVAHWDGGKISCINSNLRVFTVKIRNHEIL